MSSCLISTNKTLCLHSCCSVFDCFGQNKVLHQPPAILVQLYETAATILAPDGISKDACLCGDMLTANAHIGHTV